MINAFRVIVFNPLFDIYFQLIETCIGATVIDFLFQQSKKDIMQNGTLYMN